MSLRAKLGRQVLPAVMGLTTLLRAAGAQARESLETRDQAAASVDIKPAKPRTAPKRTEKLRELESLLERKPLAALSEEQKDQLLFELDNQTDVLVEQIAGLDRFDEMTASQIQRSIWRRDERSTWTLRVLEEPSLTQAALEQISFDSDLPNYRARLLARVPALKSDTAFISRMMKLDRLPVEVRSHALAMVQNGGLELLWASKVAAAELGPRITELLLRAVQTSPLSYEPLRVMIERVESLNQVGVWSPNPENPRRAVVFKQLSEDQQVGLLQTLAGPDSNWSWLSSIHALKSATQGDALKDTLYDEYRCAAASVVATTVLSGRSNVEYLIAQIKTHGLSDERRSMLVLVEQDLEKTKALTTESIQRLQDLLYETSVAKLTLGSVAEDQQRQTSMAGLRGTHFEWAQVPQLAHGLLPDEISATVAVHPGGVMALAKAIKPNQAVLLVEVVGISAKNAKQGDLHLVMYGRDSLGREFLYEPGGYYPGLDERKSNGLRTWYSAGAAFDTDVISDILMQAKYVATSQIFDLAPFI